MYPDSYDDLMIETPEQYAKLERTKQVVWCIHQLEAEVNNGGFHQFFSNSSGHYTKEALAALHAIEAYTTAELLDRAIKIAYPDGFPSDPRNHETDVSDSDEVMDALTQIDEIFWGYEEDLSSLVNQYLGRA